jgi:hypothetical protein
MKHTSLSVEMHPVADMGQVHVQAGQPSGENALQAFFDELAILQHNCRPELAHHTDLTADICTRDLPPSNCIS